MIKLLEKPLLPSAKFADGFAATKIKANLISYGCEYPFLLFWCQYINNSASALICKMENAVIITSTPSADTEELRDFVLTIGFSSLQAHPDLISKMGFTPTEEYTVLFRKGGFDAHIINNPPPIKMVFDILYSDYNKNIKSVDKNGFYADLSHRIRHGTAMASIYENSATALASHITHDTAIISGVATLPNARGQGYGSEALNSLIATLGERNIFAASEESVVPFYLKNNFTKYSKIAIYETEE